MICGLGFGFRQRVLGPFGPMITVTAAIFQYGIEKIYWQYIVISEGFYILKPTKYRVNKLQ